MIDPHLNDLRPTTYDLRPMTLATRLRFAPMLLLAACGTRDTQSTRVDSTPARWVSTATASTRDTSAMVVYDIPASAYEQAPRVALSAAPVTTVSGRDFTGDLGWVFRVLLLHDGRLVFFLDGSLLVLGPDGKEVERIGRSGAGPAEFMDGVIARGLGDTILVNDRTNGRLSFVVPGKGVVRMRPLSPAVLQRFTGVVGQYADDALLVASEGFGISAEPGRPTMNPWLSARLPSGSERLEILDSVAGPTIVWHDGHATPLQYGVYPIAVGWGSEFLISDGQHWSLERVAATGAVKARYRLPIRRRAVETAKREADDRIRIAEIRARALRNPGTIDTTNVFSSVRDAPSGDSLQVIAKVLIGADSVAWIKDGGYRQADARWGWTALRRDGTILGRLVGTGKDPVVAFGANRVMLKSEDEDGFVTFRVHTLTVNR